MTATMIEGLKGLRQAAVDRYRSAVIAAASGQGFDQSGISDAMSMLGVTLRDFEEDVTRLKSRQRQLESIQQLDAEIRQDVDERAQFEALKTERDAKGAEWIRQLNAWDAQLQSLESRSMSRSVPRLKRDREGLNRALYNGAHAAAVESDRTDWRSGLLSVDDDPQGKRIEVITPGVYGQ
jgi:hypothetical protein